MRVTDVTEWGVFNDEGVTDIFNKIEDAEAQALIYKTEDDGYYAELISVKEMCPDHEEQPKDGCEECFAEYD